MNEKMLVWVKECGGNFYDWNEEGYMDYLKGRIVKVNVHPYGNNRVTSSNASTIGRNYWYLYDTAYIIITPEIRAKLIEEFKKDRSLFVLKDKKKE